MSTREKGAESSLHDWRDLAEQATKETDPEILIQIVEEVCGALELRDAQQAAQRQEKPAIKKADKGDFSVDG